MDEISIGNPYLIQVHLIDSCILNCEYCYLGSKTDTYISVQDFRQFIDKLIAQTTQHGMLFNITLTGGDLRLYERHDSLSDILTYLIKNSAINSIFLLINNLWHKNSLKYIEQISDKLVGIQLNTDVIESRLSDIKYLLDHNQRIYFKIMLSKGGHIEKQLLVIDKILKQFNNNHNLFISIDRLCPTSAKDKKKCLTRGELFHYLNIIKIKYQDRFTTEDPFVKTYLQNTQAIKGALYGCSIPFGGLSIFPNGDIKLCSRSYYQNTGYTIHTFNFFEYINKFFLDRNKNVECRKCELFRQCQGGCPAIGYIKKKSDLIKKDNQCFLTLN